MPAAAIAAPVAAVAMSAATTGFGVMTAITAIGAAASVVGTLTNTPALQYAGMGLSAVGSLGSVAQSQGMLGGFGLPSDAAVTPLAGSSAGAAGAPAAAPAAGTGAAPSGDLSQYAQPTPTDIVAYINGANTSAPTPIVAQGGGEGGTLGSANNPAAPATPGTGLINAPQAAAPAPPATPPPVAPNTAEALINAPSTGGITKVGGGIWDRVTTFAKDNPLLVMGALQAGGSFLSGATDALKPAQVDALEARAERDRAETSEIHRRQANARSGVPKASRAPRGLINAVG